MSYFDDDFQHYQIWRQQVRQVMRHTVTYNFGPLLEEVRAYSTAHTAWPDFVVVILPDTWFRGSPGDGWNIDSEQLTVYLRETTLQHLPTEKEIEMYAVRPFVTPREQSHGEAFYILIDEEATRGRVAILVVEDHWEADTYQLWPIKVPELVDTWQILEEVHKATECDNFETLCKLEYDLHELPHLVPWRVIPGMKLHLTIRPACQSYMSEYDEEGDEIQLMQVAEGMPMELDQDDQHRRRLIEDAVYYQIARHLDARLIQHPYGGVTKVWLVPGEGISGHDAAVLLELRISHISWNSTQAMRLALCSCHCSTVTMDWRDLLKTRSTEQCKACNGSCA
ncbi:unnamed protein product [Durusdinium trenchii]|uniref:Uncharacterized protein n=1 Tax=Durusdinium trenchii TaxID=1381693 RepID=A0ABP0JK15_9DINO